MSESRSASRPAQPVTEPAELHTVTITPRTVYDVRCSCTGYGWDGVGKEMAETLAEGHREWVEKRHADAPIRCTCPVRSDAIGPHLRSCPNHPEAGWSRKCAYCGAASGTAAVCCADCRQDRHAHCPSWPTCTHPDYGRPCDATR